MSLTKEQLVELLAKNPSIADGLQLKRSNYWPDEWVPMPKQMAFLMLPNSEAFYGGSAGGGKASLLTTPCNAAVLGYDPEDPKQMEDFRMRYGQFVQTPFGPKLIDDVKVGDHVLNPDGTTTEVVRVHHPEPQSCYRVSFSDGASCVVGEDHLWSVKSSGKRTRAKMADPYDLGDWEATPEARFNMELMRRYKTVTTKRLKELLLRAEDDAKKGTRPRWPSVPLTEPVNFQQPPGRTRVILPGYLLGVWLGDGSVADRTPSWFKPSPAIRKQMVVEAAKIGDSISDRNREGSHGILGGNTALGLEAFDLLKCRAWEKFIPRYYLHAPVETRQDLLQGLMDTDGYCDDRGQTSFCTTSDKLALDFQYLARSLGYTATISTKDEPEYTYENEKRVGRKAYVVYVSGRNRTKLFKCNELKTSRVEDINTEGGRRVVEVVKLKGVFKTKCITVAHPNGLFITNDFIVTHNSEALLACVLQYVDIPGYAALVLRKTLSDLKLPSSLLARAHEWLGSRNDCVYRAGEHAYYFPTKDDKGKPAEPSKIFFGYIGQEGIRTRYQSAEFQTVAFDELTQHFEGDYLYLFSRLRKRVCPKHKLKRVLKEDGEEETVPNYVSGCWWCDTYKSLPIRMRSASNPGNVGHQWVKDRFGIKEIVDQETGRKRYIGTVPDRPYIPAFAIDNVYIDQAAYMAGLSNLDPVTREQLKHGDWGVSADSRFKKSWVRYYSTRGNRYVLGREGKGPVIENFLRIFTVVDPAGSAKEGPGDDLRVVHKQASWTVVMTFGLTADYHLLILDVRRARVEIPDIIPILRDVYRMWRPEKFLMEGSGLGRGVYQSAQKIGLPVQSVFPQSDKIVRSTDAQVRMEQGRIWLPEPPGPAWSEKLEGELFTWTGHPHETDDQIDCCPPGTMIRTSEGAVAIENIKVGDVVLTHEGRWRPVTKVMTREARYLYEIVSTGKPNIRVTQNHKILTHTAGKVKRTKSRKNEGNLLWSNDTNWESVLTGLSPKIHGVTSCYPKYEVDIDRIDLAEYITDSYTVTEDDKLLAIAQCRGSHGVRPNPKGNILNRYVPVDFLTCWMLGYYAAEGGSGSHNITLASSREETTYHSMVIEWFGRIGSKASAKYQDGSCTLSFGCVPLNKFFKTYRSRDAKRFPSWVVDLPKEKLKHVLLGYLCGDGHFGRTGVKASTISPSLAMQLQEMSLKLGMPVAMRVHPKKVGKPQWHLRWSLQNSDLIISWLSPEMKIGKKFRWEDKSAYADQTHVRIVGDRSVGRVRRIEKILYEGPVHNLAVLEDESYVANGVVVHNCLSMAANDISWEAAQAGAYLAGGDSVEAINVVDLPGIIEDRQFFRNIAVSPY